MRTDRAGVISLVLSAITLAIVLSIALRSVPPPVDQGPALGGIRTDVSAMRSEIAELRAIAERPTASASVDQLAGIQARLDSLDSAVGGIAAKFAALCNAVNASPFSPPGGAC